MTNSIVGIDIAKATFAAALVDDDNKKAYHIFNNNKPGFRAFKRWLKKQGVQEAWVAMEATGRYGQELASDLYKANYKVSVINPARIKRYAQSKLQRNKTDKLDAYLIADFCRTQNPYLWAPLPEELRILKELDRLLQAVTKQRTEVLNRLESAPKNEFVHKLLKRQIRFFEKEIEEIEAEIQAHVAAHPKLQEDQELLISIPGIAHKTACRLLSELGDIARFKHADNAVALAGLSPYQRQSGPYANSNTSMNKTGNQRLRTCLYMPALVAMQHNPLVQPFIKRLEDKKKDKMVIVGAVMKKLVRYAYAVLKHRKPFDPQYGNSS